LFRQAASTVPERLRPYRNDACDNTGRSSTLMFSATP